MGAHLHKLSKTPGLEIAIFYFSWLYNPWHMHLEKDGRSDWVTCSCSQPQWASGHLQYIWPLSPAAQPPAPAVSRPLALEALLYGSEGQTPEHKKHKLREKLIFDVPTCITKNISISEFHCRSLENGWKCNLPFHYKFQRRLSRPEVPASCSWVSSAWEIHHELRLAMREWVKELSNWKEEKQTKNTDVKFSNSESQKTVTS